ncbi:MAG: hypothetical protein KAU21_20980 [Gammaproteobacteria bacterium]|nr:hypothetical protein [Gammaproteobacteria bacterium]
MTALVAGAASSNAWDWDQLDWPQIRHNVYRIQSRIAKAVQVITLLHISGRVVSNRLSKGLSCMMGNYHVQFLGGKEPRGS